MFMSDVEVEGEKSVKRSVPAGNLIPWQTAQARGREGKRLESKKIKRRSVKLTVAAEEAVE